ncbi:HAMP domain-containing sensor histidine kinase [Pseudonocardia sp. GCM10023141]|uniref:HAMP domain-containing sensor histidine kinase n=1 Tax=Pseudonocardia sp. GCM10023141 TaxID=3252653 RepID=UPI0036065648
MLTAIVVNVAFSARFDGYLATQQQARAQQIVTLLTADYQAQQGWRAQALDRLAPGLVMTGSTVQVLGSDGRLVWSLADAGVDPAMTAVHRQMMGVPDLTATVQDPVMVDGRQVGTAVLQVPQAVSPVADVAFRDGVNRLLLLAAAGAGAVALLVGLLLARRTTGPLAELTAAADDLAAGHRDRRAHVSSPDELGALAQSFNAMADAVDHEDALRQAFAADISHELRTPLAILQGQLESVRDGITAPDAALIASLHDEALRMGRLVADLETMADAGAARFTLHRRPVALAPLVGAVLDGLASPVAALGISIVRRLDEVTVFADPGRISQVVTNLVTNAATYTPPAGTITITLTRGSDGAELAVADTGPGIPDDEMARVFERFFRGAAAPPGGSGIGLAVAADLVVAHGGNISVDSRPGSGSRFLVRLPTTIPATFIGSS